MEQRARNLSRGGDVGKLAALVAMLADDFAGSPHPNHRKGGLIGLAAVTVGVAEDLDGACLELIVPPVLAAFVDPDSRVRYYACEALYNVAKVARGRFVAFFNDVFDALCKLSADTDPNVQNAAHLLDRLVKDIVTESSGFAMESFAPLLRERITVLNPYVRQFLIGWITALDSVPEVDILTYLPDILDGLLNMLSDPNREIRQQADGALAEFLAEIKQGGGGVRMDLGGLVGILTARTRSPDEFTRVTTVTWLREFIAVAGRGEPGGGGGRLVPHFADILAAVLPCLSHGERKVSETAARTSADLMTVAEAAAATEETSYLNDAGKTPAACGHDESVALDVSAVLGVLATQSGPGAGEPTRLEALRWYAALLRRAPTLIRAMVLRRADAETVGQKPSETAKTHAGRPQTRTIATEGSSGGSSSSSPTAAPSLSTLLASLSHASDEVAMRAVEVLGMLGGGGDEDDFDVVVRELVDEFARDRRRLIAAAAAAEGPGESIAVVGGSAGDGPGIGVGQLSAGGVERTAAGEGEGPVDLLRRRGAMVVRRLCAELGPERVYCKVAAIIGDGDGDGEGEGEGESRTERLQFAAAMVEAMNLILLTAPECTSMRRKLSGATRKTETVGDCVVKRDGESAIEGGGPGGAQLFLSLYPCWCHSAISTVALCLLSRAYAHAAFVVWQLGEVESEVTVHVLVQIDQLVYLIESPVFAHLRLRLLEPARHPDLVRCLHALLMLLPQSDAFRTLHARLAAVPTLALMQLERNSGGGLIKDEGGGSDVEDGNVVANVGNGAGEGGAKYHGIDFDALRATFTDTRRRHARAAVERRVYLTLP